MSASMTETELDLWSIRRQVGLKGMGAVAGCQDSPCRQDILAPDHIPVGNPLSGPSKYGAAGLPIHDQTTLSAPFGDSLHGLQRYCIRIHQRLHLFQYQK